jgi:hypothetical protein
MLNNLLERHVLAPVQLNYLLNWGAFQRLCIYWRSVKQINLEFLRIEVYSGGGLRLIKCRGLFF